MLTAILLLGLSFDVRHSVDDPHVMAALQDLARRGAYQVDQTEVAAFLVRGGDGVITSVIWPHTANRRSEHYEGTIPAGTVAIAHTHPWQADQHPSRGDIEQAKKIGLPIYVVTRRSLYAVDAAGEVIELFARTDWIRSHVVTASK